MNRRNGQLNRRDGGTMATGEPTPATKPQSRPTGAKKDATTGVTSVNGARIGSTMSRTPSTTFRTFQTNIRTWPTSCPTMAAEG
ncbi:MAG TPA: hypothetical protein VF456_14180 [Vicinamibacterales bacterium]